MPELSPEEIAALPYRPCVGVVLVNGEGRIFVGERVDTPGAWQMPQGGIDAGETPEAAALRELEEETGVPGTLVSIEGVTDDWLTYDLPGELLGKVWKGRYRGQKQLWYLLRFHGADEAIEIAQKHQEFARWEWCDAEALVARIVPFKREIYRAVVAQFASHLA